MTIIVHAAGGGHLGVGHLSRTKSLVFALVAAGQEVDVIYEGDASLVRHYFIVGANYHIAANHDAAVRQRGVIATREGSTSRTLITDLLNLDEFSELSARQQGFQLLVHLNDAGIPEYHADIWVNGDAFAVEDHRLSNKVLQLVGARYQIIQPSIVQHRLSEPWSKPKISKILISMGGSDPDLLTEKFVNAVQHLTFCDFTIVIGPAFADERKLQFLTQQFAHVQFISNVFDLTAQMCCHDLLITLGGISSYEAMCLGIPVAAVTWKYLTPYVVGLAEQELLTSLGTIEQAPKALEQILKASTTEVVSRARKAWELVDGQGANRVLAAIQSRRGEIIG